MLSFDEVIGQKSIKEHLIGAVNDGKVSHAYILSGEDGSGKMMLAERFAAALQCEGSGDKPCGGCISCMQAESRNHPDIIYVSHEKKNIVVDDIRNQVVNDVSIKPYSGRYKVYIIDDAEKMNEAAQNALLKTLEEPPEYTVILLLTTNTGAFLQTILSRCVVLELKPVDNKLIQDYLIRNYHIPDYLAALCASFSCGCIGRAVRYATDSAFGETRDACLQLVTHIEDMKQSEIMSALEALNGDDEKKDTRKDIIDDYFDLLTLWFRDVLVFKATQDSSRIIFSNELNAIRKQAALRSFENLNNIVQAIDKAKQRLNANVYFTTAMELLMFTLKEH